MFVQAEEIPSGQSLDCDLAIIGAGAAGITLAMQFTAHPRLSVAVLEGGGLKPDNQGARLYKGYTEGTVLDAESPYLTHTRMRVFGGTTTHWRGWCLPLDPIDFEKRSWIPFSGWPISSEDCNDYYEAAREIVNVKAWDYPLSKIANGAHPLLLQQSKYLETRVLHRSPPTRFGQRYSSDLKNADNISVYLNASVVDIEPVPGGASVSSVRVRSTRSAVEWHLRAKQFVLATGGIENPRLLLASRRIHPKGIGNDRDLVGRFFMEHIEIDDVAKLFFSNTKKHHHFYRAFHEPHLNHAVEGVLGVNRRAQEEERLQNGAFFFSLSTEKLPGFRNSLVNCVRRLEHAGNPGGELNKNKGYLGHLDMRVEQRPNPESRVTLEGEKDELGLPKVHLKWELQDEDFNSIVRSVSLIAHELGRWSLGRARIAADLTKDWGDFRVLGGAHHMGTTRMSDSERTGVVDKNCRVHSIDNLYIAGSSVFPTAGFANPTYTIVALALRLADHLKEVL